MLTEEDLRVIDHCSEHAAQAMILEQNICQLVFGMDWTQMLLTFGGMPCAVEDFKRQISHSVDELVDILMIIKGDITISALKPCDPEEFDKLDPLIQGITRKSLSRCGLGFNYRFLVPVGRAVNDIVNKAGGLPKLRRILSRKRGYLF